MDMTPMSLHICGGQVEVLAAMMVYVKVGQAQAEVMSGQISQFHPVTQLKSLWEKLDGVVARVTTDLPLHFRYLPHAQPCLMAVPLRCPGPPILIFLNGRHF
jgi:hypothetical protein